MAGHGNLYVWERFMLVVVSKSALTTFQMLPQGHLKIKVILRSFENQIVSVWISVLNPVVGFRPNAYLTCLL